ncbi:hypothetical protein ACFVHI_17805 [Kitasatospora sp. NPDC127121]|uniref:hypothetical protein n=1 Tax=unclassified Kitasatospora TaxID=2633591 RepID=UPI003632E5A0
MPGQDRALALGGVEDGQERGGDRARVLADRDAGGALPLRVGGRAQQQLEFGEPSDGVPQLVRTNLASNVVVVDL